MKACFAAVVLALAGIAVRAQTPTPRPVTFSRDVAPILQKSCQNCHRPGSIGPMSLLTYEDARPWAKAIRARVAQRQMPPFHVDRTIGIQHFKDDPSLSDGQIATVLAWIDAGMQRPPRRKHAKPAALAMAEASAIPLE